MPRRRCENETLQVRVFLTHQERKSAFCVLPRRRCVPYLHTSDIRRTHRRRGLTMLTSAQRYKADFVATRQRFWQKRRKSSPCDYHIPGILSRFPLYTKRRNRFLRQYFAVLTLAQGRGPILRQHGKVLGRNAGIPCCADANSAFCAVGLSTRQRKRTPERQRRRCKRRKEGCKRREEG